MVQYKCPICDRKFPSKKKLREHMEKHHQVSENPPSPPPHIEQAKPAPEVVEDFRAMISKIVDERIREVMPEILEKVRKESVVERELEVSGGLTLARKVKIDPRVIQLYEYVLAHGSKMSFDEFVNETILEHFTECLGVEPAIIRRRVK